MPKIRIKAKEMKQADVTYISLVDRAASRMPFRVIKSANPKESSMINLSNLVRAMKGETAPVEPTIMAVAVLEQTPEVMGQIEQALKGLGLKTENAMKNEDGTVVYVQGDEPVKGELVRLSDKTVVVLKGFEPYAEAIRAEGDFLGAVKKSGFFPPVSMAWDAMQSALSSVTRKSESKEDLQEQTRSMLASFNTYVTKMVEGLPTTVYKVEQAIEEVLKQAKAKEEKQMTEQTAKGDGMACPEGMEKDKWDAMSDEEKKAYTEKGCAKKEEVPEGVTPEKWAAMTDEEKAAYLNKAPTDPEPASVPEGGESPAEEDAEKAKKADLVAQMLEGVKKMLEDGLAAIRTEVAEQVKAVTTKVDESSAAQEKLAKTVDEIARKSETALQTVTSTVNGLPAAVDSPAKGGEPVQKADTDLRTGVFDTAYLRRRR